MTTDPEYTHRDQDGEGAGVFGLLLCASCYLAAVILSALTAAKRFLKIRC